MPRVSILACVVAAGCYGDVTGFDDALRVEPSAIELGVELGGPAPAASLRVVRVHADGREEDVTARVTFMLEGAPLGTFSGPTLTSDGTTGGAATVRVTDGQLATAIPATAHVHGERIVTGTPSGAADAFAHAASMPFDAHLDPQDGAVLPANLGRLAIAFAADDRDDVHRIAITSPYLDLAIVTPGAPGPRSVELSPAERDAIAHTERGGAIDVVVASLASAAPATQRVTTAHLELADLDASAVLAGGVDGTLSDTNQPSLWRYDMRAGASAPLFVNPAGACIGCHIAVSPDGSRIAASIITPAIRTPDGVILDAHAGSVLAMSDLASAAPWTSAAFDPGGALVTSWQGALTVRDGATLAPLALTDAAAAPAISADGALLAYVSLDAGPGAAASQPVGNALRVRDFSAAQRSVGPARELVRDGGGVVLPAFSSDRQWIAFGHTEVLPDRIGQIPVRSSAIRTDGSASVDLTNDPRDRLATFVSPVADARAGGRSGEPMVWIAFVSGRTTGGSATSTQQLWLEAFYPARGAVAPAFHLPGQTATLQLLHGPRMLP